MEQPEGPDLHAWHYLNASQLREKADGHLAEAVTIADAWNNALGRVLAEGFAAVVAEIRASNADNGRVR